MRSRYGIWYSRETSSGLLADRRYFSSAAVRASVNSRMDKSCSFLENEKPLIPEEKAK